MLVRDFVASLTDDGLHIDNTVYINDIMGATLDPSTRKTVSALDVQILQTAYEDAAGAIISPLGAPLMASSTTTVDSTLERPSTEDLFVSRSTLPVEVQTTQTNVTAINQEQPVPSKSVPEWQFAPSFVFRNSIFEHRADG